MDEEIEIEISPQGKVTVRTKGIKGPRCIDVAAAIAAIVGREEDAIARALKAETGDAVPPRADADDRGSAGEAQSIEEHSGMQREWSRRRNGVRIWIGGCTTRRRESVRMLTRPI